MSDLNAMMRRHAQQGCLGWIGLRPERRADMVSVVTCALSLEGLAGDRAKAGKRAVTLMQQEHLAAIGAYLGQGPVSPDALRRNLVISGLNLAALKGAGIRIGTAELRLTGICAPCSRMEETFGPGGYSAVRGHGGWCAEVSKPGRIALGDAARPVS